MSHGPQRQRLDSYLQGINYAAVTKAAEEWKDLVAVLEDIADALTSHTPQVREALDSIGQQTGPAIDAAFKKAAADMAARAEVLKPGHLALTQAAGAMNQAGMASLSLARNSLTPPTAPTPTPGPRTDADLEAQKAYDTQRAQYQEAFDAQEEVARKWADNIDTVYQAAISDVKAIHGEKPIDEPDDPVGPARAPALPPIGKGSRGSNGNEDGGGRAHLDPVGPVRNPTDPTPETGVVIGCPIDPTEQGPNPQPPTGNPHPTPQGPRIDYDPSQNNHTGWTQGPGATPGGASVPSAPTIGGGSGSGGGAGATGMAGGALAGGALGAGALKGGLTGGGLRGGGAVPSNVRPIGASGKSASAGTIGRGGAASSGAPVRGAAPAAGSAARAGGASAGSTARGGTTGRAAGASRAVAAAGTGGRAGATSGRGTAGTRGASGAGAGSRAAAGAGRSGAAAGAAGGGQRGAKDAKAAEGSHLIFEQEWLDDEGTAPGVLG